MRGDGQNGRGRSRTRCMIFLVYFPALHLFMHCVRVHMRTPARQRPHMTRLAQGCTPPCQNTTSSRSLGPSPCSAHHIKSCHMVPGVGAHRPALGSPPIARM